MECREDVVVAWMAVDDKLHGHRKVIKLGPDKVGGMGVWVLAGSWSADHLTDGFVPAYVVEQWDPDLKIAARLVEVRLWSEDTVDGDDGYRFHDWCEFNRSRDEIEKSRADARERQRRSRDRRRQPDGTFGPDGGGGAQLSLGQEGPDQREHVTNGEVTRESRVGYASVTPLPNPSPTPTPKKTPRSAGSARTARETAGPEFEEWYAAYPRHVGPEDAAKAFIKVRRHIPHAELMTATRRYAASRQGQDRQFTPHPATWLNKGRYADEPDRPAAAGYLEY